MNQIEQLQNLIDKSSNIVFFTGAGISTESNIPDFRSTSGLYNQEYPYPPETILSHHFFMDNPNEFYRFYRNKMIYRDAKPNLAHEAIANLERNGKCLGVITQNIDNLHQLAGSTHVVELHGSVYRNHCTKCNKYYSLDEIISKDLVPCCDCGGVIKPDVILYEEALDESVIDEALKMILSADLLIVCGTSLSVYPAAGFLRYFRGNHLVLLNKTSTPYDNQADLIIQDSLGNIFKQINTK
ncbi:NAD-dependent protein deacylase [Anaerorhabdus furcosa]|uniref:NAD-dependent protein deacetylase n=1 Tax=Anaerorhabdus furcosa TaxID=118967 RepID=A0A1T4LIG1_9FIRM|nr:NAD-dependent protein deacylase [Anaerorhabdus furcosa]SJZ54523.1 NAD-dependent deacetylase [Anaerorhabdus furcosa]